MYSYKAYEESAQYIRERLPILPETALVLGSGLSGVADKLTETTVIPYEEIPNFQKTGVASHAGKLIAGVLSGRPVLVLSGRFHFYEGYSMEQAAYPIRMLKLLGIQTVILTNAAGGVNVSYKVGDLMLISDHIKLVSDSPVRGKNVGQFGERFFDMSDAYTENLRFLAKKAADSLGITLHEGVYFFMAGPQFETPAEVRAIRLLGGDAVGMSTVFETIAAVQCGINVLGFTCITNLAAGMSLQPLSDAEVVAVGRKATARLFDLISAILGRLPEKV